MSHKIKWGDEILSLRKICKKEGISEGAVYNRMSRTGENAETVILYYLNQLNKGNREKIELDGEYLDVKNYCKKLSINYNAVRYYKELHPEMEYIDIINMLKNNVGGGIREKLELNGKYLDVRNYCKQLNYDYKLVTRYKKSQLDKAYTEVLKEWENLSQDEILNNIHLFETWKNIIDRCYNPKNPAYKWYGGKKINPTKVYEKWQEYLGFKEDNWEEYINHVKKYGREQTSIDREDESGDYCPENCTWGDWEQQGRNKSNTKYFLPCNNYQKTLSQHCKQNGYNYETIKYYIKQYNLTPDEALARYLKTRKNK